MVNRVPSRDKTLIDPLFPIPEGAESEFALSRENTDTQPYFIEEEIDDTLYITDDDISEEITEFMPPTDLEVVKQTIVTRKGGAEVVDVIFKFTPVEGAVNYELMAVKV